MTFGEFRKLIDLDTVVDIAGDEFKCLKGCVALMPLTLDGLEVWRLSPTLFFNGKSGRAVSGFVLYLK